MSGGARQAPDAWRRYEVALGLLQDFGFGIAAPARLPRGFVRLGHARIGQWHVRGIPTVPGASYFELGESTDTRLSYPEPSRSYEYFIHLDRGVEAGRNVSFHKDPAKPPNLQYHWHDYLDGQQRSDPTPMGPATLRWFLEAAWDLLAEPNLDIGQLLKRRPPPGPGDPA